MNNITPWIEHLSNPWILIGFTLFMMAGVIKLFKAEKLTGSATAGLFHKGLNFIFILGILVVILSFANSYFQVPADTTATPPHSEVTQSTFGADSPAINSGGGVNLNFGNSPLSHQKQVAPSPNQEVLPAKIQQQTQGGNSPAVNSSGGVNVQY